MIPKYAYEVERTLAVGTNGRTREVKPFELLQTAAAYAEACKRKEATKRVVVRVMLDDWSPQVDRFETELPEVQRNRMISK